METGLTVRRITADGVRRLADARLPPGRWAGSAPPDLRAIAPAARAQIVRGHDADAELLAVLVRHYGAHDLTMAAPPTPDPLPRTRRQLRAYRQYCLRTWTGYAEAFAACELVGMVGDWHLPPPWHAVQYRHLTSEATGAAQVHTHWVVLATTDAELDRQREPEPAPWWLDASAAPEERAERTRLLAQRGQVAPG